MQTYLKRKIFKITCDYIHKNINFNFSSFHAQQSHYEILGLKPNASQVELKKAYYDKGKNILLK